MFRQLKLDLFLCEPLQSHLVYLLRSKQDSMSEIFNSISILFQFQFYFYFNSISIISILFQFCDSKAFRSNPEHNQDDPD